MRRVRPCFFHDGDDDGDRGDKVEPEVDVRDGEVKLSRRRKWFQKNLPQYQLLRYYVRTAFEYAGARGRLQGST